MCSVCRVELGLQQRAHLLYLQAMRRAACGALSSLANVAASQVPLVRDGTPVHAAVMAAAWDHSGDVDVVRRACRALWHLTRAADKAVALVCNGARDDSGTSPHR